MTGPSDDHDAGGAGTFGVDEARALAVAAHAGQLDKGGHPYLGHVERVAEAVAAHGAQAVMAGLLHDVVEDCGLGLADLEAKGVPVDVVSAVDAPSPSVTASRTSTPCWPVGRRAAPPAAGGPSAGRGRQAADNADNADEGRLARLDAEEAERLRQNSAFLSNRLSSGRARRRTGRNRMITGDEAGAPESCPPLASTEAPRRSLAAEVLAAAALADASLARRSASPSTCARNSYA